MWLDFDSSAVAELITEQPMEAEGPTTDDPGDEEESDSSESSESSDSEETSFSDSDATDTGISGRSGTTRTNGSDTESSDSRSNTQCPTVRKLLAKGCIRGCILEDSDGCPACNRTCLGMSVCDGD